MWPFVEFLYLSEFVSVTEKSRKTIVNVRVRERINLKIVVIADGCATVNELEPKHVDKGCFFVTTRSHSVQGSEQSTAGQFLPS